MYVCVRLYYFFFRGGQTVQRYFIRVPYSLSTTHVDHTSLCVCLLPNLLLIESTRSIVLVTCCLCMWLDYPFS